MIAPILVVMLVCTTDLGTAIYTDMQVQNAAQAGGEYAILHGFDVTAITSAVLSATTISGISVSSVPTKFCGCPSSTAIVTATCGSTCTGGHVAGTYVTVSAKDVYTTMLHYPLVASSFTFTAQSTVRIQ